MRTQDELIYLSRTELTESEVRPGTNFKLFIHSTALFLELCRPEFTQMPRLRSQERSLQQDSLNM